MYKTENMNDVIRFLNSRARDFYQSKHTFKSNKYDSYFKANLQVAMVDIERTFRGTFGCDIFLKYADRDFVKEMFPNAYTKVFRIRDDHDFKMMGRALETLRNINSHAELTERDFSFFDYDYSYLESEPKMNASIVYFDKEITIAGLIYIICNFLRQQSLANLIKSDFIFSVVVSGKYEVNDGSRFVEQISHVDLELPIRKERGDSILDSVFGDYKKYAEMDGENFNLIIGSAKYPTTEISGHINESEILINQNSLSRVFYSKEYCLKIDYAEGFIELANELPSFALVDYLYASNISIFNEGEYRKIKSNFEMVSKLNYPKFYTNKNVGVLLLPRTISDFTMLSALFSDSLLKYLLILEAFIYKEREFTKSLSGLSSIGFALNGVNTPQDIIVEMKFLRNFVAHGYLLNEYLLYDGNAKQYTIEFALHCLKELITFFKENDVDLYEMSKKFLGTLFVEKVVNAKYKKAFNLSHDISETYPRYDEKDFIIKNSFIDHSYMNIKTLNEINALIGGGVYVLQVHIKGLNGSLFFRNTDKDCDMINDICERCGLDIEKEIDEGILYHYYLS